MISIGAQWNDLVAAMTLGTARGGCAAVMEPALPKMPGGAETALLRAAAVLVQMRRAGDIPEMSPAPLPPPSAYEDAEFIGDAASDRLDRILSGDRSWLLREWLDLAAKAGLRARHADLPALLERARTRPELRFAVAQVGGARGLWLAAQNPDWAYLLQEARGQSDAPDDGTLSARWETSTRAERLDCLVALRRRGSSLANELIGGSWKSERAQERLGMLSCLETGLSSVDEALLVQALTDRAKEVRERASGLLALLPGSGFSERMRERARLAVRCRKGPLGARRWLVEPPEWEDSLAADALVQAVPALPGLGERAWWLSQIVGRVAPRFWTAEIAPGSSLADVIAGLCTTQWKSAMLLGLCAAAVLFRDEDCADALLRSGEKLVGADALVEKEMLEAVQADVHLVATLIALRSVIPIGTRDTARQVVRGVVDDLMRRLAEPTRSAIVGSLDRARRTRRPRHSEIDWNRTIKANLQHYQPAYKTIVPQTLIGFGRKRRSLRDIVLCIDQSGSMASSVVYASVFGAVMASLPAVSTQMIVFDTSVVDLTDELGDPVDLLFGVQLGGGTNIDRALAYCRTRISRPQDTILVLISDLYEGGSRESMLRRAAELVGSGVKTIALLALSNDGAPSYDHGVAQQFAALGIPCFACTPDLFPDLMAQAIRGGDIARWAAGQGIVSARAEV